jgi:hypothetical protein
LRIYDELVHLELFWYTPPWYTLNHNWRVLLESLVWNMKKSRTSCLIPMHHLVMDPWGQ